MSVTDLPRSSSLSETRENGRIAGLEVSDNQERIAPDGGFKRRARLTRDIIERAGITEAMIEGLVKEFYGHIQVDALLGPIFAVRIADWEAHITKLCRVLVIGCADVRTLPRSADASSSRIAGHSHFDQSLGLFERATTELCPQVLPRVLLNAHIVSPTASN